MKAQLARFSMETPYSKCHPDQTHQHQIGRRQLMQLGWIAALLPRVVHGPIGQPPPEGLLIYSPPATTATSMPTSPAPSPGLQQALSPSPIPGPSPNPSHTSPSVVNSNGSSASEPVASPVDNALTATAAGPRPPLSQINASLIDPSVSGTFIVDSELCSNATVPTLQSCSSQTSSCSQSRPVSHPACCSVVLSSPAQSGYSCVAAAAYKSGDLCATGSQYPYPACCCSTS